MPEIYAVEVKVNQITELVSPFQINAQWRRHGAPVGENCSAYLIFFGLPEDSLVNTRKLVDGLSSFLIGSVVG